MSGILAIAGKDLRSLFLSPLFYVVTGICSLFWSAMYLLTLNEFASKSRFMSARGGEAGLNLHYEVFSRHIYLVNFLMIMAVAALTMRLFADEKKQRTYDLLLTSPVTATQVTLGKFIAGLLSAWSLVLVSALYPISTAFFAEFDWGPLLSSYVALLLIVGCYVAVGMFASSLTESSVLAVIMGLIFSVGIWFLGAGLDVAEGATWTAVFEHLSVGNHFVSYLKGSASISGAVFLMSLMALFGFLTQRVVESSRWR